MSSTLTDLVRDSAAYTEQRACFPAKAGIQSGLPPSRENKEVRAIITREFAQALVRLSWTAPMVDRLATVTRHAGMENHAR